MSLGVRLITFYWKWGLAHAVTIYILFVRPAGKIDGKYCGKETAPFQTLFTFSASSLCPGMTDSGIYEQKYKSNT